MVNSKCFLCFFTTIKANKQRGKVSYYFTLVFLGRVEWNDLIVFICVWVRGALFIYIFKALVSRVAFSL